MTPGAEAPLGVAISFIWFSVGPTLVQLARNGIVIRAAEQCGSSPDAVPQAELERQGRVYRPAS